MIGEVLDGRYRIVAHLGSGAFGQVFRAEHELLGVPLRTVAVKCFRTADGDGTASAEALLTEALHIVRAVDRCEDPVVRDRFVACHDAGVAERPYLVMELTDGSLAGMLTEGRWPPATVAALLREICEGVAFLHDQGTVHLDLKPANVLRSRAGTMKVADFGCMRRITDLYRAGSSGGTITHQPPEVVAAADAGTQADVYAIGLIGYQLLTGRLPHEDRLLAAIGAGAEPDHAAVWRVKMDPSPPPGRTDPALEGHPLAELLVRATSPGAADRPADGRALLVELDRVAAPTATRVGPARSGPTRVRERIGQMERAVRLGDLALALRLAAEAKALHDPLAEPVADLYPVLVHVALACDDTALAQAHAQEGLRRAPHADATRRAAARAYAGTAAGRGLEKLWGRR